MGEIPRTRASGFAANGAMVLALVAAAGLALATAGSADWDLPLLCALLAFAVVSDLWAIDTSANPRGKHRLLMSGSFLALVLAMVLLGGPPAALVGVAMIAVGHLRFGERADLFLNNLVAYAWFPLVGGLAFSASVDALEVGPDDGLFYALVVAVFLLALGLNFAVIAGYNRWLDGASIVAQARRALIPVLPWDLASAVLAGAVTFAYLEFEAGALVLFGVVLLSAQRLLGEVFAANQRAEQLEDRISALASLHAGLLNTIIRTLDLRDRMTARHSVAVAHYSSAMAAAIGMTEEQQRLVHTAGLMHDIGKFNLPDKILKADVPLTDDDWALIRSHPAEGARLLSYLDGYDAAADLVHAHHERYDGSGYPQGLRGMDIPLGARIISVADTYDVMTSRDSYRQPVAHEAAVAELWKVAGTQLDPAVVSVFCELLSREELRYSHADDADFEAAVFRNPGVPVELVYGRQAQRLATEQAPLGTRSRDAAPT